MDEVRFERAVSDAIASGNADQLRKCVYEISTFCYYDEDTLYKGPYDKDTLHEGPFPQRTFEFILRRLEDEQFLQMDGASYLVALFETEFARLSDGQKSQLLPALERAYPRFKDWMSCFVLSELIGRGFGDVTGLVTLRRLKAVCQGEPLHLIPHGFEYIVMFSRNEETVSCALQELNEMLNDPSEAVRSEVELSFSRIARSNE